MSTPDLSIIIPAYDEAQRIGPTLRAVAAFRASTPLDVEVLVVDDGSRDATREIVEQLGRELGGITLLGGAPNRGKGHAVKTGMLYASGRLRLFTDADGSTPILEADKLLEAVDAGAQVAIGSRRADGAAVTRKQPLHRRLWSRIANRVIRAGLLDGIEDTQCGFKLFTAEAAQAVFSRTRTAGWGFDLEALALARRLGFALAEVPVEWADDRRTRLRLSDAFRITREFLRIRRYMRIGAYDLPALVA